MASSNSVKWQIMALRKHGIKTYVIFCFNYNDSVIFHKNHFIFVVQIQDEVSVTQLSSLISRYMFTNTSDFISSTIAVDFQSPQMNFVFNNFFSI